MAKGAPRGTKRTKNLVIALTDEEYETILSAAAFEDMYGATWARNVLLSRALGLYRARTWGQAA